MDIRRDKDKYSRRVTFSIKQNKTKGILGAFFAFFGGEIQDRRLSISVDVGIWLSLLFSRVK